MHFFISGNLSPICFSCIIICSPILSCKRNFSSDCDYYIPVSYIEEGLKDFKRVPGEIFNASPSKFNSCKLNIFISITHMIKKVVYKTKDNLICFWDAFRPVGQGTDSLGAADLVNLAYAGFVGRNKGIHAYFSGLR